MARSKGSHPPKEKPPGSPRTFSTVPYPRTCSLRAKRRPPLSLSFFHSAYFVCFVPKRVGGQQCIFYGACESHGLKNIGSEIANYVVFEFHGKNLQTTRNKIKKNLKNVIKRVLPKKIRTFFGFVVFHK